MTPNYFTLNNYDSHRNILDISYCAGASQDFHYDQVSRISIILSGSLKEEVGRTEIYAHTGALVIKPNSVMHRNKFGPHGTRMISILVTDTFVNSLMSEKDSLWNWYTGERHSRAVWKFLYWMKQEGSELETIDHVIELVSHLASGELPSSYRPPWLDSILDRIHAEYNDSNLLVRELARTVDVHPVYLARVFRKFQLCSVKDYIQCLRLQQVSHALATTTDPLSQIAYMKGFSDQSHMTRYFRNYYGMSPGNFRKFSRSF